MCSDVANWDFRMNGNKCFVFVYCRQGVHRSVAMTERLAYETAQLHGVTVSVHHLHRERNFNRMVRRDMEGG